MPKKSTEALQKVEFRCSTCEHAFAAVPARIEDAADRPWHPWEYFHPCPRCDSEAEQAPWQRSLTKAWAHATGPKTAEGKAAAAANLEGHPTAEEAQRTRLNAMKHGLNAKVATYFPASPGKYAMCKNCSVDWGYCATQPACSRQTQLFMMHQVAFDSRDPKHLKGLYSDFQAACFSLMQLMLQTIIADGVKISKPVYYEAEDGSQVVAEFTDEMGNRRIIYQEMQAHPLFKPLGEMISRNNLSLADMGMTAKVMDDEEAELGRLAEEKEGRESLTLYAERNAKAMEGLTSLLSQAKESRSRDPVLIEYQRQQGEN